MRRIATGLLVLMTVVFITATILERDHGWATWVRVTAEASMIGALADWFAVVALFRHPLGIPIPHTAIIPKRKDQIGRALGTFVQESFLTGRTWWNGSGPLPWPSGSAPGSRIPPTSPRSAIRSPRGSPP